LRFAGIKDRVFVSKETWRNCLTAFGLNETKAAFDPVTIATEGALWGAIRHQGLLERAVVLSDDAGLPAGSTRGSTSVCTPCAGSTLVPANDKQRNAIENAKRMIWRLFALSQAFAPSRRKSLTK
jgi:hypothetical protein